MGLRDKSTNNHLFGMACRERVDMVLWFRCFLLNLQCIIVTVNYINVLSNFYYMLWELYCNNIVFI